jgi:hypothetical protein
MDIEIKVLRDRLQRRSVCQNTIGQHRCPITVANNMQKSAESERGEKVNRQSFQQTKIDLAPPSRWSADQDNQRRDQQAAWSNWITSKPPIIPV